MTYSKHDLINAENPYELLSNGNQLAENADILNSLNEQEQVELASKVIENCPALVFKNYNNQIQALAHQRNNPESFYLVLSEAHQVRSRIYALLDPNNKKPQNLFLKEFHSGLFHRFSELAHKLLKGNEQAIAERLALCAPDADRSTIAHNVSIAFPRSALATNSQLAFALRNKIDHQLLGDNPEKFFTNHDYNKDACIMFMGMFRSLLKNQEVDIAAKLSSIVSDEVQTEVRCKLELLHTEIYDGTNPFKLIASAMVPEKNTEKQRSSSSFFYRPPTPFHRPSTPVDNLSSSEEGNPIFYDPADSEEDSECFPSISH